MKDTNNKKRYRTMLITLLVIGGLAMAIISFFNKPSFGRQPSGERLRRIENTPNYRMGQFRNLSHTPQLTSDKSFFSEAAGFLFRKIDRLRPDKEIPAIKAQLKTLDAGEDVLVWFGHGSYFMQLSGKKFLIDPVFYNASPVSFFNKPFKGTDLYKPKDIPDIDYLIITHDHWDHLDHKTVRELRPRTGKVICPLGVGEHFGYWGFPDDQIIEMYWNDSLILDNNTTIHCLPARHFSGRGLSPNKTLWASYLLGSNGMNIFMSGDGGYDTHFKKIKERFGNIDLAIMENGQYDQGWKYIHLLPEDLTHAIRDLAPKKVMTVHNSKYALGKHAWDEPLIKISQAAQDQRIDLITPMIGEVVRIGDNNQKFSRWWEGM